MIQILPLKNTLGVFWLLLLCHLPFVAYLQNGSEPAFPKSIEQKLQKDAARLSLRYLTQDGPLGKQNVEIPQDIYQNFYDALSAIYLSDSLARKIEKCNIHTFPSPSIENLVVIFKKTASFLNKKGEISNPEVLRLIKTYGLTLEKQVQWNDGNNALVIRSGSPLNMAALADKFYKIEGVTGFDLGIPTTLGNDIRAKRIKDGWEISYLLFFGAHIGKNGKLHMWTYQVTDDGAAKFLSESGDELPEWMDCTK